MFQLRCSLLSVSILDSTPQQLENAFCDLPCEQGRHSVSDLAVLLRSWSLEQIVVGECLEPSGLADSEAAALTRVAVDVVMAVFGNMTCDGGGGPATKLD